MQVKKQQLELDMEQQTGSKLGKEYVKAVCCHPAYLLQSTSCKMLGWMKHKLEARLQEEISITPDMQMIPLMAVSEEELKSLLMKVKVAQWCPTLCDPIRLYSPWNSPGQNTGVDSLSLLQGIFPTQGLNSGLPHCRQILYQLSHK